MEKTEILWTHFWVIKYITSQFKLNEKKETILR